jgi:hypothetical protein
VTTVEHRTAGAPAAARPPVVRHLFATPVAQIPCPEAGVLNPLLRDVVFAREARTTQRLSGKAETVDDLHTWAEPAASALTRWVVRMAGQMVERVSGVPLAAAASRAAQAVSSLYNTDTEPSGAEQSVAIRPVNAWASLYRRGDAHDRHMHPNTALAAVYYVDTPPGSSGLVLHDPRAGVDSFHPGIRIADEGAAIELSVDAGDLVLFPGWLAHSVPPSRAEGTRIAVSYNLAFHVDLHRPA